MTWSDFWAYGWMPLWLGALAADRWMDRRFRRHWLERWGVPYDGP